MFSILIYAVMVLPVTQARNVRPEQAVQGTVHVGLVRDAAPHLRRRLMTGSTPLINNVTLGGYLATVQVGTPPQQLTLQVDTGSSDTWLPWVGSNTCRQRECIFGSYDPGKSLTTKTVQQNGFNTSYLDGSGATGDLMTDKFSMGTIGLDSLEMGLGIDMLGDVTYGLIGIGFPIAEGVNDANSLYTNLPGQLKASGIISTSAYSLWLDSLNDTTGNLLFGGVDTKKFQGDTLTRIKMYPTSPDHKTIIDFSVTLTSITAISPSGKDGLGTRTWPIIAVLDSGTTHTFLPADMASQIFAEAGAIKASGADNFAVPCDTSTGAGYLSFGLGGPGGAVINVSLSELVLESIATPAKWPYGTRDACLFGIHPTNGVSILGDTFLRSAYVVYDMENLEIGIAQTEFADQGSTANANVVAFASESARIPNSTPAPSQGANQVNANPLTASPTTYLAQAQFTEVSSTGGHRKSGGVHVFGQLSYLASLLCLFFVLGVALS